MIIQNNAKGRLLIVCMLLLLSGAIQAREYHVSVKGDDTNKGTAKAPFKTISKAAEVAQPGDFITVHEGTYCERIYPPRGGESDKKRIVYQVVPGEKVVIKGSEVIKGWQKVQNDTWKVVIPNSFFGDFNPYSDLINGDWFNPKGRNHHTGAVYLSGHWLTEAAKKNDVLKSIGNTPLWFGQVGETSTTIWAQFGDANPNEGDVEINVRQAVFYPEKVGVNFITVRGFTIMHAATPWAPPTAEQIGLIGTHWSKGWVIENNDIRYSTCVGITLGKHGDQWDNTSANTAEGYVKTIERAVEQGWSKENIGHHLVRIIWYGTTISRIASKRASSEAWARFSAPSQTTSSTTSISVNCLLGPRWPVSRFTVLLTRKSAGIIYTARAGVSGWTGWRRGRV
jgi:alpha-N-arabinofuranosidase